MAANECFMVGNYICNRIPNVDAVYEDALERVRFRALHETFPDIPSGSLQGYMAGTIRGLLNPNAEVGNHLRAKQLFDDTGVWAVSGGNAEATITSSNNVSSHFGGIAGKVERAVKMRSDRAITHKYRSINQIICAPSNAHILPLIMYLTLSAEALPEQPVRIYEWEESGNIDLLKAMGFTVLATKASTIERLGISVHEHTLGADTTNTVTDTILAEFPDTRHILEDANRLQPR